MSITAKQTFTTELQERLSDKLTLKEINAVIESVTHQMAHYDMERLNDDVGQQEFEDMLELFSNAKRIEGRSEKTIERYQYILKRFRKFDKTPIREEGRG